MLHHSLHVIDPKLPDRPTCITALINSGQRGAKHSPLKLKGPLWQKNAKSMKKNMQLWTFVKDNDVWLKFQFQEISQNYIFFCNFLMRFYHWFSFFVPVFLWFIDTHIEAKQRSNNEELLISMISWSVKNIYQRYRWKQCQKCNCAGSSKTT